LTIALASSRSARTAFAQGRLGDYPVSRHPVDHRRLNELVAINDHYVLSPIFAGQILRKQFRIGTLLAFGNIQPAINLLRVDGSKRSAVVRPEIHVGQ
jgi:hypothetical protein